MKIKSNKAPAITFLLIGVIGICVTIFSLTTGTHSKWYSGLFMAVLGIGIGLALYKAKVPRKMNQVINLAVIGITIDAIIQLVLNGNKYALPILFSHFFFILYIIKFFKIKT